MLWLILALAVVPFLHFRTGIDPVESAHVLALVSLGVAIVGAKIFRSNRALSLGIFSLLASYLICLRSPLLKEAFLVLVFSLVWMLFYLLAMETNKDKLLIKTIVFVAIANTVVTLLQVFHFDILFWNMKASYPVFGMLGSKGNSAIYQAIALPLAWSINPMIGVVVALGLVLLKSSVGLVAGAVGLLFYLSNKYNYSKIKNTIIAIIMLIGVIAVEMPRLIDFKVRFANVLYSLQTIDEGKIALYRVEIGERLGYFTYEREYSPWFGYGLGSFKASMPFIPPKEVKYIFNDEDTMLNHPHNDYVFAYYEMGLIGLLALIAIILTAVNADTDPVVRAGILAAAIGGLGYFVLLIPSVTLQLATLLAINDKNKMKEEV